MIVCIQSYKKAPLSRLEALGIGRMRIHRDGFVLADHAVQELAAKTGG
jgi:hypothetical protein